MNRAGYSAGVVLLSGALVWWWGRFRTRRRGRRGRSLLHRGTRRARTGYAALIGDTPLVELRALSRLTGRTILAKAEYLNPGGTGKDRIALAMLEDAEARGDLPEGGGGVVVEGTSGSTGIALAALCAARGYRCVIVMPDDQAEEKRALLRQFGAEVRVVRPAAIANPDHYVNVARRLALDLNREAGGGGGVCALFTDQFETPSNKRAHVDGTGAEIWAQTKGKVDAFVMSAGTGGTIAGVSQVLKARTGGKVRIVLADPPGSSLYNLVKHGVCWAPEQAEKRVRKHRYDSVAEGIGLDRVTWQLAGAAIDDAVRVSDQEALHVAHYLMRHEGLFVGSSSAMNLVAALRYSMALPPGSVVVTVLCDSGQRHQTRFWNPGFVAEQYGLSWPQSPEEIDDAVRAIVQTEDELLKSK